MAFTLRLYQQEGVDAVIAHIKKRLSPCLLELATGAGKSLIVAELARYMAKAAPLKVVLCIAPSKELIIQNWEKYESYGEYASIFCASAGSKCLSHQVIFASPLTAKGDIEAIAHLGVSAIIIDEAHQITPTIISLIESIKQYKIGGIAVNEKVRIIGMTATPYRMGTGYIYASDHTGEQPIHYDEDKAIDPYYSRLLYRVTAGELVSQGFLSKVIIGEPDDDHYDASGLTINSMGKFNAKEVSAAFDGNSKTERITNKIISHAAGRMGVIIFAATISHAEEILSYLPAGQGCVITGKTKKKEREDKISAFKARKLRYLVNVDVLTTGFDAPHVDVVAIMRATESASLLQQIIGRGLRLHPEKDSCLILDYAENIKRHGLESDIFTPEIKTKKAGESAGEINVTCPACGARSSKKRRNDPQYDGVKHNYQGNYLVPGTETPTAWEDGLPSEWDGIEMTIAVLDPSSKDEFGECGFKQIPIPAHYARICSNKEAYVQGGLPIPCGHRYSFKMCPHCYAENDIAARHCCGCKERLVDPNEKLTEIAGQAGVMADGETKELACAGIKYAQHIGKSGKYSVKVVYETEIGSIMAWHTKGQHWIFVRMATANGWEIDSIGDDYAECAEWQRVPVSIKVKKTIGGNGYSKFEVKGVTF